MLEILAVENKPGIADFNGMGWRCYFFKKLANYIQAERPPVGLLYFFLTSNSKKKYFLF
jgi:hypothetical protein